jgi:hypothetical protein
MAEKTKNAATEQQKDETAPNNLVNEPALVEAAMANIKKSKDEKKTREIEEAIGMATFHNLNTRAELRARRREDEITKEKLDATKKLLERLIGFECEIKDGCLVPTKNKCKEPALSPVEYKDAKKELQKEIDKKISESTKQLDKDKRELRASYEGRYMYWWD